MNEQSYKIETVDGDNNAQENRDGKPDMFNLFSENRKSRLETALC